MRPMFGALGRAVGAPSLAFVSPRAQREGRVHALGLTKQLAVIRGCRGLTKRDMKLNDALPRLAIDPETYQVRANGELLTCEPAPLAQGVRVRALSGWWTQGGEPRHQGFGAGDREQRWIVATNDILHALLDRRSPRRVSEDVEALIADRRQHLFAHRARAQPLLELFTHPLANDLPHGGHGRRRIVR